MVWVLSVVGALIGLSVAEFWGLLSGAALGFLGAQAFEDRKRFSALDKKLITLQKLQDAMVIEQNRQQALNLTFEPETAQSSQEPLASIQGNNLPNQDVIVSPVEQENVETSGLKQPEVTAESKSSSTVFLSKESATKAQHRATVTSPPMPKKELPIDKVFNAIKRYFTEGNVIVRVGVVVMFFGLSFLVKYSIDNALLPIEVRLIVIAIAAFSMLGLGWRLRTKNEAYALILQGGGVAAVYLVIFSAYRLYGLLPAGVTFPLLILFSLLAMSLAVLQNSRALAVTAIAGGFASPILASSGGGSHVALFSYYLILNFSIFAVSWFKSWRMLNVIGFAFTFIIGSIWGATEYSASQFSSTEPFLIAFFLLYVAISVLFACKQVPELKGYVDGTLVFGVPLVGFGLQSALVYHYEYGLAWSAFALGAFYLSLVSVLWRSRLKHLRVLCEAMLVMGVIFTSLIVPFALDGRLTAATWAIEGAGFVWLGLRQLRPFVKYFGVLLQVGGALLFLIDLPYTSNYIPFLNTEFLGILIVSLAAIASSFMLSGDKDSSHNKVRLDIIFLVSGIFWWYVGGAGQVVSFSHGGSALSGLVVFVALSSAMWATLCIRLRWSLFSFFPWLFVVPMYGFLMAGLDLHHLLSHYGYIAWPLAFSICFGTYFIADQKAYTLKGSTALHATSFILLVLTVAVEASIGIERFGVQEAWVASATMIPFIGAIAFITHYSSWPVDLHALAYQKVVAYVLFVFMALWSFGVNLVQYLSPGPLPYIPLLNPVDISQALIVIVVVRWVLLKSPSLMLSEQRPILVLSFAGFCFLWFNSMMLKTLHSFGVVAYDSASLFESSIVQMSVSISWSVIGLAAMVLASRIGQRKIWLIGAGLAGIVVLKLFVLDLSERETVERIISFLVVGMLLLVVGYFSPMPPKKLESDVQSSDEPGPDQNISLENSEI